MKKLNDLEVISQKTLLKCLSNAGFMVDDETLRRWYSDTTNRSNVSNPHKPLFPQPQKKGKNNYFPQPIQTLKWAACLSYLFTKTNHGSWNYESVSDLIDKNMSFSPEEFSKTFEDLPTVIDNSIRAQENLNNTLEILLVGRLNGMLDSLDEDERYINHIEKTNTLDSAIEKTSRLITAHGFISFACKHIDQYIFNEDGSVYSFNGKIRRTNDTN